MIEKMEDIKTAKGVKRAVKDQHLSHSHYKDTLMSLGEYTVSQNLMRSQDHVVTNRNVKKVALTEYDTKRWILDDGISTRTHGHHLNTLIQVKR